MQRIIEVSSTRKRTCYVLFVRDESRGTVCGARETERENDGACERATRQHLRYTTSTFLATISSSVIVIRVEGVSADDVSPMAQVTLVMGGARSGKSSYASRLALSVCEAPVYLATSRKFEGDDEFDRRVALHKADRASENWVNVEEEKALSKHADSFRGKCVVVDCATLWLTNFFLDANNDGTAALAAAKAEFDTLVQQWDTSFIFVSNEIGSGVHAETAMGRAFVDAQGWLNQHIGNAAQRVVLMVAGQPLAVKEPLAAAAAVGRPAERRREAQMLDSVLSTRAIEMDAKGYFILRVQPQAELPIVAEYHSCETNEKGEVIDPVTREVIPCHDDVQRPPARVLRGRTAKEVQVKLFEAPGGADLVCHPAHACYVGRELQRAEACLEAGTPYQMD